MKLAIVGDVHGEIDRLRSTLDRIAADRPSAAFLVGDLGVDPPRGFARVASRRAEHDASVRRVVREVAERLGCPVAFVPGNHDLPDPPLDVAGVNCDSRVVECAGLRVAGLGGAGPSRFGFPYEWDEGQADRALAGLAAAEGLDVLISHTPPVGTALDRVYHGLHVGSEAVRRGIGRLRPRLFLCGHIHEALGLVEVDGVPCLNAGALGVPFAREIAWIVRWTDAGPDRVEAVEGDGPRSTWMEGGRIAPPADEA